MINLAMDGLHQRIKMANHPNRYRNRNDSDLSALLRSLRAEAGLTQEECAMRLGVGLRTWNRWEAGEAEIPWRAALLLLNIIS